MFNSKKRDYKVYTFEVKTNAYGEQIKTKKFLKTSSMFISFNDYQRMTSNDVRLKECTYTAITNDFALDVGMVIEDRWQIIHINSDGKENLLYLKEVVTNG